MALCELYMGVHAWGVEDPYLGYAQRWLFGGLCGLLPRRRLQPGSAARAEPVFPTRRETATEGALPAHHGGWGARATRRNSRRSLRRNSVHKCPKTAPRGHFRRSVYTPASPRPLAQPPASQQCTQMPQNGAERPFSPICVHSCVTTAARATGRGHRSIGIQAVLRGRGAPWCPSWPGPFSCPWRVEPL